MDFTKTDLFIRLPFAFLHGFGWLALRIILHPFDKLYQQSKRLINSKRRRRLTESRYPTTLLNTHTSHFLDKLPLEIRQEIYQLCYEGSRFVLDREGVFPTKHYAWMHDKDWRYLREDPGMGRVYVQKGVLNLPLTCRQVYSESINYIYSIPTFESFGMSNAFELPTTLLPQRWSAMTSFKFWFSLKDLSSIAGYRWSEWQQFWRTIAMLPRVKRVEVRLWASRDSNLLENGLAPLMAVNNIPAFDVCLGAGDRPNSRLTYTSAPFRLSWYDRSDGMPELVHLGANGELAKCRHDGKCCVLTH